MIRKVACEVGACLVLLLFVVPCQGQQAKPRTDTHQDTERPRSLVTLELVLADEAPVSITVVEGTLATFARPDHGFRVGLIPHVVDEASGDVEIDLVSFTMAGSRPTAGVTLDTLDAKLGFRTSTAAVGQQVLDVTVTDLGNAPTWLRSCSKQEKATSTPVPHASEAFEADNRSTGCCLSCGGATFCGCAVSTSCGSCCNCSFC